MMEGCKVQFTVEQQQSILGAKGLIHKQRKNLQETLQLLNELQQRVGYECVSGMNRLMIIW